VRLQDGGTGFVDIAGGMGEQPEPAEEEFKVEECSAGILLPLLYLVGFSGCFLFVPGELGWLCVVCFVGFVGDTNCRDIGYHSWKRTA
jgi:hypothetical protein